MPKITKQTVKGPATIGKTPTKSNGVLDRIVPVIKKALTGVKLNIYGRGKTGKTRLACDFPKPLLLIGTEDGTKSVKNIPGVDFVPIEKAEDVEVLADMIRQGGGSCWRETAKGWIECERGEGDPYKSTGLDTAGGLQNTVLKEVLGLSEIPVQRSWGMAQQRDWGIIGQQTKERLSKLLSLADIGINVVVIAHERSFGDNEDSEIISPQIGPALTPTAAGWLNGECDYVCQMFIREEEVLKETKVGDKTIKMKATTGKKQYCLRVGPHSVYMTGFRLPVGAVLPDLIIDPTFAKIEKLIQGK